MKKILSILMAAVFWVSSFTIPVVMANEDDDFVNENVLLNSGFEDEDTALKYASYSDLLSLSQNEASGWYQYNQASALVEIVPEPDNEDNHVLSINNVTGNWFGVVQVLPVTRVSTGDYNIKFRVKNAGSSPKASVSCRLSFLIRDNSKGTISRASNAPYRPVSYGFDGTENTKINYNIEGNDWNEFDFDCNVIGWTGTKAYKEFFNYEAEGVTIVGIMLEIRPNFGSDSTTGVTSPKPDTGYDKTLIYVDDVSVTMPDPLFAEAMEVDDTQNVPFENPVIPLSFNYTDGIYSDSLDNITIEDNYGNTVKCTAVSDGAKVNVSAEKLNPDTEYKLIVDKVVSSTPVPVPSKNPTENAKEKRYVSMIGPKCFTFKTKPVAEVTSKSYDAALKKASVSLKLNDSQNEFDKLLVIFDESDSKVNSPVYYKPVHIDAGQTAEVTFENAELSGSDYKLMLLNGFDKISEQAPDGSRLNIEISNVNQTIALEGAVDAKYAGMKVCAEIMLPDDSGNANNPSEIDDTVEGKCDEFFLLIKEAKVNEDGSFAIDAVSIDKSGTYKAVVTLDGAPVGESERFFSSKRDNDAFLDSINALSGDKAKADKLFDIIEAEAVQQKIRYDQTYYNMLSVTDKVNNKKLAAANIAEKIPFGNIDDFTEAFINETALLAIIKSDSAKTVYDAVNGSFSNFTSDKTAGMLKLEDLKKLSVYKDYSSLSQEEQLEVFKDYAENVKDYNQGIRTAEGFADAFSIVMLNRLIASTALQKDIASVLLSHEDVLDGFNFTDYNQLALKQSQVNTQIKANVKGTLAEFVDYVNSLIKAAKDSASTNESPRKGGGSGGGSSSYITDVPVKEAQVALKPTSNIFNDLNSVPWAQNAVNTLCERGIVSGRGNGVFDPDGLVTREEFVKMIVESAQIEIEQYTDGLFDDVSAKEWYAPYIAAAAKNGITNGIGEKIFGAGQSITRQDMFVMCSYLIPAGSVNGQEPVKDFADSSVIADYAQKSINTLSALQIINGDEKGCVNPLSKTTRAEAAKVIYEILRFTNKL